MLRFTYQKKLLILRSQEGSQAGQKGKWGMKTLSGLFCLKRISHQSPASSIGMPYDTLYLFLRLYSSCNPHLNLLMLCSPFSFIISIHMGYLWNGFLVKLPASYGLLWCWFWVHEVEYSEMEPLNKVFGLEAICTEDLLDRSIWNLVSDYTTHALTFCWLISIVHQDTGP